MQTNSGSRNRYTGTLSKDFNKDVKATQWGNDSPFNKLGLNNGTTLFCKTKASTILWHYIKTLTISLWGLRIVWCTLTSWYLVSLLPVSIIHVSDIFLVGFWSWEVLLCGAAGAGAGRQPGLRFRFPWNGGIPRPHRVTWSQPINMHPVKSPRESWKARGRLSLNKSPRRLYQ